MSKKYSPGSKTLAKMMKGFGDTNVKIGKRLPINKAAKPRGLPIMTGKSVQFKSVLLNKK